MHIILWYLPNCTLSQVGPAMQYKEDSIMLRVQDKRPNQAAG